MQTEVGTHTKEGGLRGHREGKNQKPMGWLKYKTGNVSEFKKDANNHPL